MTAPDVPLWASVHLTHAALQAVAVEAGADLLHIKGPAVDRSLRAGVRDSTDADVLVRPSHLDPFLERLREHGWVLHTDFAEGSSFRHAANYRHPVWTFADVHRHLPGLRVPPEVAFDRLWSDRVPGAIAHRACAVPGLAAQVLVQTLHTARSPGRDVADAWSLASPAMRDEVRRLAGELGASVALAAGIGELSNHVADPDHALWEHWSRGGDRLGEWLARLRASRTSRDRAQVIASMLHVNRTHLRLRLGHEPTRLDVAREQVVRAARAGTGLVRHARRRRS